MAWKVIAFPYSEIANHIKAQGDLKGALKNDQLVIIEWIKLLGRHLQKAMKEGVSLGLSKGQLKESSTRIWNQTYDIRECKV